MNKLPQKNELIEIPYMYNKYHTVIFFAYGTKSKKIIVHDCCSMFCTTRWRFPGEKKWRK